MLWKIEEPVGNGLYIVWDGLYTSEDAALAAIARTKSAKARAVRYCRGQRGRLERVA